jgi:hypothetical protein
MDFLLAGTLDLLRREFQCRVIVQRRCSPPAGSAVENIPLQAERHSGRRQKLFAFPLESAFTFRPECCSESQRNGVQLQTGIAFTFDRIPQLDSASPVWRLTRRSTTRTARPPNSPTPGVRSLFSPLKMRVKISANLGHWEASSQSRFNAFPKSLQSLYFKMTTSVERCPTLALLFRSFSI